MQYCTTSCTRASQAGSILAVVGSAYWSQDVGRRMALKPEALANCTNSRVILGLPQAVSDLPPVASRVLPMFRPMRSFCAVCGAVSAIPVASAAVGWVLYSGEGGLLVEGVVGLPPGAAPTAAP